MDCVCGENAIPEGKFMLDCDGCHNWSHGDCVGVSKTNVPATWFCHRCSADAAAERTMFHAAALPPPVAEASPAADAEWRCPTCHEPLRLGRWDRRSECDICHRNGTEYRCSETQNRYHGLVEQAVPLGRVRTAPAAGATQGDAAGGASSSRTRFAKHMDVEVRHGDGNEWFAGTVQKVRADGSLDIQFLGETNCDFDICAACYQMGPSAAPHGAAFEDRGAADAHAVPEPVHARTAPPAPRPYRP